MIIYLDESGDLGWKLDAPQGRGGSSKYLTIAALCVPFEKKHFPNRVVKNLYEKFNLSPKDCELKWGLMKPDQRKLFALEAHKMCNKHSNIYLKAIVVKKENVQEHIRNDGNKLYNYMIRIMLLDFMSKCDVVKFIPDPRSIKVKSGNSLHDYLQTELWFTKNSSTNLITEPCDSKRSLGLQFTDMLAGIVQSRFERNNRENFQLLQQKISIKHLFF
jgi:hypothetical protein